MDIQQPQSHGYTWISSSQERRTLLGFIAKIFIAGFIAWVAKPVGGWSIVSILISFDPHKGPMRDVWHVRFIDEKMECERSKRTSPRSQSPNSVLFYILYSFHNTRYLDWIIVCLDSRQDRTTLEIQIQIKTWSVLLRVLFPTEGHWRKGSVSSRTSFTRFNHTIKID